MQAPCTGPEIFSTSAQCFPSAASLANDLIEVQPIGEVVYLVDADPFDREMISTFLTALNMRVVVFASAYEYLEFVGGHSAACLILNTRLPDISGFELQRRVGRKFDPPVIFISDQCDIASTVSAMKAGAIDFLAKPVNLKVLAAAVRVALEQHRKQRQKQAEIEKLQERHALLTRREREVLPLIVGGLLNKQAASVLGISEVTLQIHRSQVMRKMQADSFAELVRMAVKLRVPYWRSSNRIPALSPAASSLSPRNSFRSPAQNAIL